MIRSVLAIIALGLLGLFGYFFVTAPAGQDGKERAKTAAVHVGEAVMEEGAAGLVRARLATSIGLDGVRFLHVHFDNGNVLIYGLIPPGVRAENLAALARNVPGVTAVDVQVVPRPAYLDEAPPAPEAVPTPVRKAGGHG